MKKLIFEDTTVIKKPFVEIDGVEYEVQDGEFEGGTDLNAQNFNQVQNNIGSYIDGETSMGSIIVEDIECKNLFNKNTVSTGYYLNNAGNLEANAGYVVSDFIEVEEGKTYFLPIRGTSRTKFYDSSKKATTDTWDVADGDISFVIPNGVKYIRISIATSVSLDTFQFEKGTKASPYTTYRRFGYDEIESMGKIIVDDISCKNLFNDILEQGTLSSSTGVPSFMATRVRTKNYQNTNGGETYTISCKGANSCVVLEYTNDLTFLKASPWQSIPYSFTTDNNTSFFRIVFRYEDNSEIKPSDVTNIQLEKGIVATNYIEHKEFSYTLSSLFSNMFNLPSAILSNDISWDDLYIEKGIKFYAIGSSTHHGMPSNAYGYGILIVITNNLNQTNFANTQIYITDGINESSSNTIRGLFIRNGIKNWCRISGSNINKIETKASSTTSTTNNENLELTDM